MAHARGIHNKHLQRIRREGEACGTLSTNALEKLLVELIYHLSALQTI